MKKRERDSRERVSRAKNQKVCLSRKKLLFSGIIKLREEKRRVSVFLVYLKFNTAYDNNHTIIYH